MPNSRAPLNVYLTVDTEVWWSHDDLSSIRDDFDRWFHGKTPHGDFGVEYQINRLNESGLKAVYFIEPLFASAVDPAMLREMVEIVQTTGHDVQLHLHTEWLPHLADSPVSGKTGEHIREFNEDDQTALLEVALNNLRNAGAENVCAFRAGNYGANNDTLRALARNQIRFDTSHNTCYLGDTCAIDVGPILQPCELDGVVEYPIAFFSDLPGHNRHAQLTACSFAELSHAMNQAWEFGWRDFVIVFHSFELLDSSRTRPDRRVINRFDRLCQMLGANRDRFTTCIFDGSQSAYEGPAVEPLRSNIFRTSGRLVEQVIRRIGVAVRNRLSR